MVRACLDLWRDRCGDVQSPELVRIMKPMSVWSMVILLVIIILLIVYLRPHG
jgi:hypothetical protein